MAKRTTETKEQHAKQVELFKEAARELECDDDEGRFRERLNKLTEAPPPDTVQERKLKLGVSGGRKDDMQQAHVGFAGMITDANKSGRFLIYEAAYIKQVVDALV